jgi:hypothetical protein
MTAGTQAFDLSAVREIWRVVEDYYKYYDEEHAVDLESLVALMRSAANGKCPDQ